MITSTTTCTYDRIQTYDGSVPMNKNEEWNFSTSTCVTQYPDAFFTATQTPVILSGYNFATITTSTDFRIDPKMTGGEIIIIGFLLVFSVLILLQYISMSIAKITTGKKYMAYKSGEVEIKDEH